MLFNGIHTAAAHTRQSRLQTVAQLLVVGEKAVRDQRRAIQQSSANEQLSGTRGIDLAEINRLTFHFKPVQQQALGHQHATCFGAPMRLAVAPLQQVRADLSRPLRINAGHGAREELGGLHDLAGHDPQWLFGLFLAGLGILFTALIEI